MYIYRRKLPHIRAIGHPAFVTWRLHGSVPVCKGESVLKSDPRPGYAFVSEDRLLDRAASGPRWLSDTRVASLVAEAIESGDTVRGSYHLHAWVIMPNHVHLLITPIVPLPEIMRYLKCSSAHKANLILERTGQPFWHQESFDRWIRNSAEFNKTVRYIEHNPVSAGLTPQPELWPWSSVSWAGASAYPT